VRVVFLLLIAAAAALTAILLARRNWRLGRIDRKGALRIGAARFILGAVIWMGTVHAVPSADMIAIALSSLAGWLLWGAGFWLLYIALEPSVRAHWPHSIVSWNRVLAGRWRDPHVGSHVLIGAAVGAAVWTTAELIDYLTNSGMNSFSGLDAAMGTRHWVAAHAGTLASSLLVGLVCFFALTGLRQLVKKDVVAAGIAAVFFAFSNSSLYTSPTWKLKLVVYVFIFGVLLWVLLRSGLVTIMAAVFFIDTFEKIGVGWDWKTWYAPAGLATVALLAGIAVVAFVGSLGAGNAPNEAA
jgi:serine/threonine-protein kinase